MGSTVRVQGRVHLMYRGRPNRRARRLLRQFGKSGPTCGFMGRNPGLIGLWISELDRRPDGTPILYVGP